MMADEGLQMSSSEAPRLQAASLVRIRNPKVEARPVLWALNSGILECPSRVPRIPLEGLRAHTRGPYF